MVGWDKLAFLVSSERRGNRILFPRDSSVGSWKKKIPEEWWLLTHLYHYNVPDRIKFYSFIHGDSYNIEIRLISIDKKEKIMLL